MVVAQSVQQLIPCNVASNTSSLWFVKFREKFEILLQRRNKFFFYRGSNYFDCQKKFLLFCTISSIYQPRNFAGTQKIQKEEKLWRQSNQIEKSLSYKSFCVNCLQVAFSSVQDECPIATLLVPMLQNIFTTSVDNVS